MVLLAAACGEQSTVDPDATVVISGRALTADGSALADRPVRLATQAGAGEVALAVLTLGLSCSESVCVDGVRSAATDPSGAYRLELRGRDTQTGFGNVRQQALMTSGSPRDGEVSGPSVTARFVVQSEQVELPDLRLVDPDLSLASSPSRVGASWATSSGGPYVLTFESDTVVPVWKVTTGGSSATVDSRVLEGTSGRAVLSGSLSDQVVGSDVDVTWRSPGLGYASSVGAPVSRGLPCSYRAGVVEVLRQEPCALTDGDLFSEQRPPSACPQQASATPDPPPACTNAASVTFDLPDAPRAELVAVRGCVGTCPVEVSDDGVDYRSASVVTDDFTALRVPPGVAHVRVGLGTEGLREVSVWGPVASQSALRPVSDDDLDGLRQPYAAARDEGAPVLLIALAAGLAGAAVLGLGFLLGRRRQRT